MNFKRFNGSTWETVRHKIYGSGTDSMTAFPAKIQAAGEPLTNYTIYGNTVQDGTPLPEAPVDVVGCGVRTGNLFDKNAAVYGEYLNEDGTVYTEVIQKTAWLSDYIPVTAGLTYTLNLTGSRRGKFFKADKTPYQTATMDFSGLGNANTFTIPETVAYIRFTIYKGVATPGAVMLNLGSAALPYEPYGYKLPITVNGTEHPIYLGQVPTTRQIKKFVLTGEETVTQSVVTNCVQIDAPDSVKIPTVYSSHFQSVDIVPAETMRNGKVFHAGGAGMRSVCFGTNSNPLTFKQWLSDQYAAGTPVTVWYVLAEPETGIVNEPLHKIGDYADTISFTQAGVAIPTSDGDNTISFGTSVQPSAMSATFKGWHPVHGAKQYDGSEWR